MASHAQGQPPPAEQRQVILVAEDSPDVREMYRIWMELSDFNVVEATDGVQAIHLTHQYHPDAVVMDLSMPRLDGWEACRRLKADPRTRDIPILAVSAHGYSDARRRALEAGCDRFVEKPCTPETLEACLRELLANRPDIPA